MVLQTDPAFVLLPKAAKRLAMYIAQGGECWYCGCPMAFYPPDVQPTAPQDNYATIEHITPLHYGSRRRRTRLELNRPFNKVLACYRCNQQRGDRPLTSFIGELRELGFTLGIVARIRHLVDDHRPAPWQASEFDWYMVQALAHPRRPGDALKRLPAKLEAALLPDPAPPMPLAQQSKPRLSVWGMLRRAIQQLSRRFERQRQAAAPEQSPRKDPPAAAAVQSRR